MYFPGTSVYSILYFAFAGILLVAAARYLIGMWRAFFEDVKSASTGNGSMPEWAPPLIRTIIVIAVYVVVVNFSWNVMQGFTTNASEYQNPAEVSVKHAVQSLQLPSAMTQDSVRSEQKRRAEVKPHQQALDSFDESMRKEAEEIRKRNANR